MNDYKSALKEYQEIQFLTRIQLDDMLFILDKMDSFKNGIMSGKEHLKMSVNNNSDEFNFINPIFKSYLEEIDKIILSYNEKLLVPFKSSVDSFRCSTENNLKTFNKIKTSLIEGKQKVKKAKDDYYDFIKYSNKNNENKDDQNELFNAKKDNYAQLYKYEINKMNEIITKNNKDYDEIFKSLNNLNITINYIAKNILFKFCEHISDIGKQFIKLSEKLSESLKTNYKEFEKNQLYKPQINKNTNLRFNLETFEEFGKNNGTNNDIDNDKNGEEIIKDNNINNQYNNVYLKNLMSLPRKGFDDFEIIDEPIIEMDQERMKEIIKQLKEIIKKLASENELTPLEINQLINILKEEPLDKNQTFSYIFLNQIKKFYKNRVKNFKNRQNFIHLANIMNNLCIKEDKTKTYNEIIEVSQMIKYDNLFMFCMIQKKNHYFSTKSFWLRLIEENIIDTVVDYSNQLYDNKNKKNEKKAKIFKNSKDILLKGDLIKEIINYDKFYEEQKIDLGEYAYEKICLIISKTIPGMCSFLVPEFTIIDIINYFCQKFGLDSDTKIYFINILEAKNNKNTLSLKKNTEKSIKKNNMFNILFIISSTLKFLPQNEFIKLIPINKFLKPYIEKKIFKFLLSNKNLTIEKRIELWENILNVKNAVKLVNYQSVKSLMKERIEKKEIAVKSQEQRNLDTIDVDLIRTPFIRTSKNDMEKLAWVLRCLNYAKPDVGYCQGMNYLALFFYQLLDFDEERTFNFIFALEIHTKYEQIFQDDLRMLKIFFIVLDKIINLYKPEIYYKFVDNNLSTNLYSTSWFVTVFTNINSVFEKKNYPKYVIMVMENFIIDGWSAIFNSGFTLTTYHFDKIMKIEEEALITFMIKYLTEEDIVKNENFHKIKEIYEKNSEKINEFLVNKLVKIARYENTHSFLKTTK